MVNLDIRNLGVAYGRRPVVSGLSAAFRGGEVVALIGPNGTGKSSLLRAMAGLQPSSGLLSLDGRPLPRGERRSRIAYMPQDGDAASGLSVLETVLLGHISRLGAVVPGDVVKSALSTIEALGLGGLVDRRLDAISGGQRQLTYLAQTLVREPQVLLLDEPTGALDLRHQMVVLEKVRSFAAARSAVVIAAMHDLSLAAQFADRILCLNAGKLEGDGPPASVLTVGRLRRVYGVEAEITVSDHGRLSVVPWQATTDRRLAAS